MAAGMRAEAVHAGERDVLVREREDGWRFRMDIGQIRAHVESFPFGREVASKLAVLWREMEDAVGGRRVGGHWPAKLILATRSCVPAE
ncbi:hypothetical protein E4U41_004577 [Claviceps citrina]|nr:hypothetical protein E4U41_004577 [Claviceps citrina]